MYWRTGLSRLTCRKLGSWSTRCKLAVCLYSRWQVRRTRRYQHSLGRQRSRQCRGSRTCKGYKVLLDNLPARRRKASVPCRCWSASVALAPSPILSYSLCSCCYRSSRSAARSDRRSQSCHCDLDTLESHKAAAYILEDSNSPEDSRQCSLCISCPRRTSSQSSCRRPFHRRSDQEDHRIRPVLSKFHQGSCKYGNRGKRSQDLVFGWELVFNKKWTKKYQKIITRWKKKLKQKKNIKNR